MIIADVLITIVVLLVLITVVVLLQSVVTLPVVAHVRAAIHPVVVEEVLPVAQVVVAVVPLEEDNRMECLP